VIQMTCQRFGVLLVMNKESKKEGRVGKTQLKMYRYSSSYSLGKRGGSQKYHQPSVRTIKPGGKGVISFVDTEKDKEKKITRIHQVTNLSLCSNRPIKRKRSKVKEKWWEDGYNATKKGKKISMSQKSNK